MHLVGLLIYTLQYDARCVERQTWCYLHYTYVLYQAPESFRLFWIIVSFSLWYNFSQSIKRFCLILNVNCTVYTTDSFLMLYSSIIKTTLEYAAVTWRLVIFISNKNILMHSAGVCGSLFCPLRSQTTNAYSYPNAL